MENKTRLEITYRDLRYSFLESSIDYVELLVWKNKVNITEYFYKDKTIDGVAIISKAEMLRIIRDKFDMPVR